MAKRRTTKRQRSTGVAEKSVTAPTAVEAGNDNDAAAKLDIITSMIAETAAGFSGNATREPTRTIRAVMDVTEDRFAVFSAPRTYRGRFAGKRGVVARHGELSLAPSQFKAALADGLVFVRWARGE